MDREGQLGVDIMECGECTLCCRLLEIKSTGSKLNQWCKHCKPDEGCSVYTVRPEECREYNCSWKLMDVVHPSLRPDKSKIIWEATNDHIMFGVHHPDYEMSDIVKQQIKYFVKSGNSVVISMMNKEKPVIYPAKGHISSDIWAEIEKRVGELSDDSA